MILEIYIAFFALASIFLAVGLHTQSAPLTYLAMGLFIFSSLVMADQGIDIITGTNVTTTANTTTTTNQYENLNMDNNFFVMSYVYIFLILPIIGIFGSISLATNNMRR